MQSVDLTLHRFDEMQLLGGINPSSKCNCLVKQSSFKQLAIVRFRKKRVLTFTLTHTLTLNLTLTLSLTLILILILTLTFVLVL
jgi:hypothetical protein